LGATGQGGVLDPVILPASAAQLADHARRVDAWHTALRMANGITPDGNPGSYGGLAGTASVLPYGEPNSSNYRNYCGPGSSQILISNWTSNVPSIDTLAWQEKTNPNTGTYLTNMVYPINADGGTGGFYINQVAGSQGTFSNWIGADIYAYHHPLITAIETRGNGYTLNGWTLTAPHIVTVYGFNFVTPGAGYVRYMESSSAAAGTSAQGPNTYSYDPFWSLVTLNNGQIW
jgi:hypothetical protein